MSLRSQLKKSPRPTSYVPATKAKGSLQDRVSNSIYKEIEGKPFVEQPLFPKLQFTEMYRARAFDKDDCASKLKQDRNLSDEVVIDEHRHPAQTKRHVAGEHQGLANLQYNCEVVLNDLMSMARKTSNLNPYIRATVQRYVDVAQVPVYVVIHECLARALESADEPLSYAEEFPHEREYLEKVDQVEGMYLRRVRNALKSFTWVPGPEEEDNEKVLLYIFLLDMRDNMSLLDLWLHLKDLVKRYCPRGTVSEGYLRRLQHEHQELLTCFLEPNLAVLHELLVFLRMIQSPTALRGADIYRDAIEAAWPLQSRYGFEPVLMDAIQHNMELVGMQARYARLVAMESCLMDDVRPSARVLLVTVQKMITEMKPPRKRPLSP